MSRTFLKVGDLVQIKQGLDIFKDYCMFHNRYINDWVTEPMMKHAGKMTRVTEITSWGKYRLEIDNGACKWTDEMLDAKIGQ